MLWLSFFYLTSIKFLNVSFDLLSRTRVYQESYNYSYVPTLAGSMEYFGKEHLPYGILAIFSLCVFVILYLWYYLPASPLRVCFGATG